MRSHVYNTLVKRARCNMQTRYLVVCDASIVAYISNKQSLVRVYAFPLAEFVGSLFHVMLHSLLI